MEAVLMDADKERKPDYASRRIFGEAYFDEAKAYERQLENDFLAPFQMTGSRGMKWTYCRGANPEDFDDFCSQLEGIASCDLVFVTKENSRSPSSIELYDGLTSTIFHSIAGSEVLGAISHARMLDCRQARSEDYGAPFRTIGLAETKNKTLLYMHFQNSAHIGECCLDHAAYVIFPNDAASQN